MTITRRNFLVRSGAALFPWTLAGSFAALAESPKQSTSPNSGFPHFNVRRYGAKGDGRTKDTKAIQKAIDAAGKMGGVVFFPAGKFLAGTLRLKSHVTVHLDAGATLLASPDKEDFDPYEKLDFQSSSDEETTYFNYALLRGQDVEHVGVIGPGTIDGNRIIRGGPKLIALKNCRHVAIRDVTLKNSPNYNLSFLGCDFVDVQGVTILNGYADGIDPDCCHHVRIANCFVESWDDGICPKASDALGYRRSTENVVVTNCVISTASNAFKLGTESSGDFKNITVSNCTVFARPDLWNRYPTSGVSIEMVDGGSIDRVVVSNIAMADVKAPIFIRQANRGRAQKIPKPDHLENISISDLNATGALLASSISGIPGFPVRRVTLKNIRITSRGGGAAELAHREVPEMENEYPDAGRFGELPAYGLYCRHVETLMLDNLNFHLENPDARPALIIDEAKEVDLRTLLAEPPSGDEPVLGLRDVRGCFMQGLRAKERTKTFVQLSGEKTARIHAAGNDFSRAEKAFQLAREVNPTSVRQEGNILPSQ